MALQAAWWLCDAGVVPACIMSKSRLGPNSTDCMIMIICFCMAGYMYSLAGCNCLCSGCICCSWKAAQGVRLPSS